MKRYPAEVIYRSEGVRVQVYTRITNGTTELAEDVFATV